MRKELLTVDQIIQHMKNKGITFNYHSEEEACEYLLNYNNYFKLASYRKNYTKNSAGQYANLDFAYLRDLAIIDMSLRYAIVQMTLDVEHHTKLEILRMVERNETDGYSIVEDFINSLPENLRKVVTDEIERNQNSIYTRDIIDKYRGDYPIWAFVEVMTFGRLLNLYSFCAERYNDTYMRNNCYRLKKCKELRNAAAHSNCILNDLGNNSSHKTNYEVSQAIMLIPGISKSLRTRKMKNERIQQIVTLLYVYINIVKSTGLMTKTSKLLTDIITRMNKNICYYEGNDMIKSSFEFLEIIIKNWLLTEKQS